MSIINLALVLVYNSVCFIRLFWLLISSLGEDHNLNVLRTITSSLLVHIFLITLAASGLANYYSS